MGLVSNGGAAFFLLLSKSGKHNYFVGSFFGVIAATLIVAMLFPSTAISGIGI
jgi:hypothetical protein